MLKAPVNKVIEFSNVDGPGNRTVIFFQSCPFNCKYCHNPETINLCLHCGLCIVDCPTNALSIINNKVSWNNSLCIDCDQCINTCPHSSSPKTLMYTVDQVLDKVKINSSFIRGITTSGGECMEHASFLYELFKKIKALDLSSLIDSNGYYLFEDFPKLLSVCDGVMLDVKAFNNEFHLALVGKDNINVLENLKYLLSVNKLQEVRTVLLPNFDEENEKTVTEVSKIIGDKVKYKLLRYRPFGVKQEGISFISDELYSEDKANALAEKAIALGASLTVVI